MDDEVEAEYLECATNVEITVNVFKDQLPPTRKCEQNIRS